MARVNQTVAVITGAAGGLGAAIARALAREGRALVLCDLSSASLETLTAELGDASERVTVVAGDVTLLLHGDN